MSWLSRFANAFRSERLDRDLEDELQYHIEARTADLVRDGMDPAEAARVARRRFGNQLAMRESSREAKLFPWIESLFRDARFGARILMKERNVTAAAVLSLSLAIGACTAAFSLLNALILRPLPVPHPDQLIGLSYPRVNVFPGAPSDDDRFSYPTLQLERGRRQCLLLTAHRGLPPSLHQVLVILLVLRNDLIRAEPLRRVPAAFRMR